MKSLAIGLVTGRQAAEDPQEAFERAASLGVEVLQLGGLPHTFSRYRPGEVAEMAAESGVRLASATVVHEGEDYSTLQTIRATGGLAIDFEKRLDNFKRASDWLAAAEVRHITSHIGFIPEDRNDPMRGVMADRVRAVSAALAQRKISLGMETGQETAENLKGFLAELALEGLSINLDPANMILYGAGDPIAAVAVLGPAIKSVHCKDAMPSNQPGILWGREVVFGAGAVNAQMWLRELISQGFAGPLVIEREGGRGGSADILAAVSVIRQVLSEFPRPMP